MVMLALMLFGLAALIIYVLISKLGKLGFMALIAGIVYLMTQLKKQQTT